MKELPSTRPRTFFFVLMPFEEGFNDVYQLGIKQVCREAGAYCERVDEQIFHERILDRIYNQIAKADCIIADMTGRNANVFYEVGYAHALGKPTILLTRNADDIPFDLKHFPHVVYGAKLTELRTQLKKRVKWVVENSTDSVSEFTHPFELFIGSKSLTTGTSMAIAYDDTFSNISIALRNVSSRILNSGDLKTAIIAPEGIEVNTYGASKALLPNGMFHYMLPDPPSLFPEQVSPIVLKMSTVSDDISWKVLLRIYTSNGPFDFPLTLTHELLLRTEN